MSTAVGKKAILATIWLILFATISCAGATETNTVYPTKTEDQKEGTGQITESEPKDTPEAAAATTQTSHLVEPQKATAKDGQPTFNTTTSAGSRVEPPPTLEETLEKGLSETGASPVQLALRGKPDPESVRCNWRGIARTLTQRQEAVRLWLNMDDSADLPHPEYLEALFKATSDAVQPEHAEILKSNLTALARGGLSEEYLFLTCFTDYAVSEYILGDGPTTLTVAHDHVGETPSYDLYVRAHDAGEYGDETLRTQAEHNAHMSDIINVAETSLKQQAASGETVIFLAPMGAHHAIAFETWQVVAEWQVQDNGDGTSTVTRHGTDLYDPEYQQSLANLKSRVTAAATDDFADSRIANISGLTQYYRDIGAYDDITPDNGSDDTFMPAMPPPLPTCAGSTAVGTDPDQGLVDDCNTLLTAKDTLAGTASLNWSKDTAMANWDGIRLRGSPKRVQYILLTDQELDGNIPPYLGDITELRRIDLDQNNLSGQIPPQLGNLKKLDHLYLFENELTGAIPPELGYMESLQVLYLEDNQLTGKIPAKLGKLSNLTQLVLGTNQLTGPVPEDIGNIPGLAHLILKDNDLTGQIPRTLSSLTFANLALSGNPFTGCLPTGLDQAGSNDLFRPELTNLPTCGPTFGQESYSFTVAQSAPAGTTAGTVTAQPYDQDGQITYAITAGNEANLFSIDATTGAIALTRTPTQEDDTSQAITVEAQDGHGQKTTVPVAVTLTT